MATFRLGTIEHHGRVGSAILIGERLYPLSLLAPDHPELHTGLFELLQRWDEVWPTLKRIAADAAGRSPGVSVGDPSIRVLAPVRYPRAIFCTVFNYYDFADDTGAPRPDKSAVRPYVCTKLPHCVVGPDETIVLPAYSERVDWEVELGAIIGRPCRNAFARDALSYVAGYTIVNDLSTRDGNRPDWPRYGADWLQAKGFDTSAPIGPCLLPSEFLPDPSDVRLRLWRNGALEQDGNTRSMVFTLEEQIAYISSIVTLQPGDIIATGTPAGVGLPRGRFLQPGDEVVCEIDRIGRLRNPVIGAMMLAPLPRLGSTLA